ncbi:MAG TPA: response regulator [Pyrinomonadaceae bacterium]|nr:response regulator [Pyrinomonadaceae bacterium]
MKKRVLIVDDEENIRRMMRLTLEAAGHEVGEADNGQRGLDLYGDGSSWDVVLLDQRMPGMDGLEVLSRLKSRDAAAQVIMVTAYASVELAVDAMKLGATDFVRKPMTPEILRGAVTAAVSKSAKRRAEPPGDAVAQVERPQIETITLNGFEIIRPTAAESVRTQPDEHVFIVQAPHGKRSQVVVKVDDEAVSYVERITRRRLAADNSFWAYAAERLLSDYLWNQGKIPPTGKLSLKDVDRDQLIMAERWSK